MLNIEGRSVYKVKATRVRWLSLSVTWILSVICWMCGVQEEYVYSIPSGQEEYSDRRADLADAAVAATADQPHVVYGQVCS